jgi:hypothetical protein
VSQIFVRTVLINQTFKYFATRTLYTTTLKNKQGEEAGPIFPTQ